MKGTKPKVLYSYSRYMTQPTEIGKPIYLIPLNHPNEALNGKLCETSHLVKIPEGEFFQTFETENTIYVPVED